MTLDLAAADNLIQFFCRTYPSVSRAKAALMAFYALRFASGLTY